MDESAQFSPKTEPEPLAGSVHAEYVRCGKAGCRCARGELHGPYYRRFWRDRGRTRSAYIRLADVPTVAAACDRYAFIHMSRRAFWRMLREFERRSDEIVILVNALAAARTEGTR